MVIRCIGAVLLMGMLVGCTTSQQMTAGDLRAEWNAAFETNLALQEDLIRLYRDCMERQGFTTHPDPDMGTFQDRDDPFAKMDAHLMVTMPSREYAEVHGLSASMPEILEQSIKLSGPGVHGGPDGSLNGLSQREYGEYYEALNGYNPNLVVDESQIPNQEAVDVGDREVVYSTAGCRYDVQSLVFDGEVRAYHQNTYLAKNGIQQGVVAILDDQPEVRESWDDWSSCMADSGYPGLGDIDDFRWIVIDEVWNPIAAEDPQPGTPEFQAAKQDEVDMVMVHIECDERIGLRELYLDTVDRLTDEYLLAHEPQLFSWYESLVEARERTAELLA